MKYTRRILLSAASSSAMLMVSATSAAAQQIEPRSTAGANQTARDDVDSSEQDQTVIVTGTSIRGVASVGSPVVSIGRADLERSVRTSPVDLLRELPQVSSLGADDTTRNVGGNVQRGRTINLRGIGAGATLILIDGNRVAPTGNVLSFVDADQLPTSALERIEVVAEGASAIYGSDAVAGVVNYITRKRFEGIELTGRSSLTDGYKEFGGSAVTGFDWGSGSAVIAYDFNKRSEMRANKSPFITSDLRRFGGNDNRINGNNGTFGAPGSIAIPRTPNTNLNPDLPNAGANDYYTPIMGRDGRLTFSDLVLNDPVLLRTEDFTSYLPPYERHQGSISVRQEILPWLEASLLTFFNTKKSDSKFFPSATVNLVPGSPFYISGIPGLSPTANQRVVFSFAKDIDYTVRKHENSQFQIVGNLRAELPADWVGQLSLNYSRNKNCASCHDARTGNVDVAALQAAVTAGLYNPLSAQRASDDVLDLFMPAAFDRSRASVAEAALRFDGPLFALPGGEVKAAVGASYMEVSQFRIARGGGARDVDPITVSRNVKAAYGELYIPLVGGDFTLPAVQEFIVNLALRTEKYSDFGSTTNPKVGVSWEVFDGFRLRGSWGQSFRAPNLIENTPELFTTIAIANQSNGAGDPAIPINVGASQTTILRYNGSSSVLLPETAETLTAGFDFRPVDVPGLSLSGTYYDVTYDNQIVTMGQPSTTFLTNAANRALYSRFITPVAPREGCVPGNVATYPQLIQDVFSVPTSSGTNFDQSNICNVRAILDGRFANTSKVQQRGIDVQVNYEFDRLDSSWRLTLSGTKILSNKLQVVPGGTVLDALDVMNQPVSLRGRASVAWTKGAFTVIPTVNYVGSYTNDLPITLTGQRTPQPRSEVPEWVTVDLAAAIRLNELIQSRHEVDLNINIQNLFDRDPPIVLSTNGNAFDNYNANPYGRIVSMQVSLKF